jgi:hypothetical protein
VIDSGAPRRTISLNPELPTELDRVIARLLEKDRELRYPAASALASDLRRLRGTLTGNEPAAPVLSRANRSRKIAAMACLAAIAIGTGAFFSFRRQHPLGPKDTIVLADFVNHTGDPVFDGTLRQGLAIQLSSRRISVSLLTSESRQRLG